MSYYRNNVNEKLHYDQEFYDQEFIDVRSMQLAPVPMPTHKGIIKQPRQYLTQQPNASSPTYPQINQGLNARLNNSTLNQFDVTVQKIDVGLGLPTTNIPFVLFAPSLLVSNYNAVIKQFIPVGVSLSIERNSENIKFLFRSIGTPANGVDIILTSDIADYPTIVESLITDRMNCVRIRETVGNVAIQSQLQQAIRVSNGSMFGGFSSNPISAASQRSPFQQQEGIIDFDGVTIPLDKFRAVMSFIVSAAPSNFFVTYSFWVTDVKKY